MEAPTPQTPNAPRRRTPRGVILLTFGLVAGLAAGIFLREPLSHLFHRHHHAAATQSIDKQLWTCGMHPQVIQDKPGLCPICNMALEPLNTSAKSGASTSNAIHIDPVVVQNMGVRVAQVAS